MAKTTKKQQLKTGISALLNTPPQPASGADDTPTKGKGKAKATTPPTASASAPKVDRRKTVDPATVVSVTVKTSFRDEVAAAAEAEGVSVNALAKFFLADGLARLKAGKLKLPKITVTRLSI